MKSCFNLYVYLLGFLLISCNQIPSEKQVRLGVVDLEVSGNEPAKEHFKKGLLLLHSFEYIDAREAFEAAEAADPDMAMAYWGQAMTFNHSIWFEQDFEKGTTTLERMDTRQELKMDSELEKDFITAIEILYEAGKTKLERDQAYAAFLGSLHQKYPDNLEVAAFYSLSLLGTVSEGRDYDVYGEAAAIAKKVLEENPKHPGALHYLIHSYDDPDHARLALKAADAYARVAPDAAHALHMPSHIYVAMGMWDDVVASNEDSYGASIDRMERKSLSNDARGYHSYHWLQYGYLQQGRTKDARDMTLKLKDYVANTPSKRGRSHMVFLQGTYLVETDEWDGPIADIPVEVADLNITIRGQHAFTEGMKAFRKSDKKGLELVIENIQNDLKKEAILVDNLEKGFPSCTNLNRENATQTDLGMTQVMIFQMEALKAWLEEDPTQTEKLLQQSITLENELSYSYGPPVIQKPTFELYADWLLSQERVEEALAAYQATLTRAPNRTRTLEGVKHTSELLGKKNLAMETQQQLESNTSKANKA